MICVGLHSGGVWEIGIIFYIGDSSSDMTSIVSVDGVFCLLPVAFQVCLMVLGYKTGTVVESAPV